MMLIKVITAQLEQERTWEMEWSLSMAREDFGG